MSQSIIKCVWGGLKFKSLFTAPHHRTTTHTTGGELEPIQFCVVGFRKARAYHSSSVGL